MEGSRTHTHTPSQTLLNAILITIFTLRTSNLVEVVVVVVVVVSELVEVLFFFFLDGLVSTYAGMDNFLFSFLVYLCICICLCAELMRYSCRYRSLFLYLLDVASVPDVVANHWPLDYHRSAAHSQGNT